MDWEIDRKKCLRCGACVSVCPVMALELREDGGIQNDSAKCTLCGICQKVCPAGAIKVEK
jgi:ferredoxin